MQVHINFKEIGMKSKQLSLYRIHIKEFKKTTTATATSQKKGSNKQNNGFASPAKQQREMTKLCVVWRT